MHSLGTERKCWLVNEEMLRPMWRTCEPYKSLLQRRSLVLLRFHQNTTGNVFQSAYFRESFPRSSLFYPGKRPCSIMYKNCPVSFTCSHHCGKSSASIRVGPTTCANAAQPLIIICLTTKMTAKSRMKGRGKNKTSSWNPQSCFNSVWMSRQKSSKREHDSNTEQDFWWQQNCEVLGIKVKLVSVVYAKESL